MGKSNHRAKIFRRLPSQGRSEVTVASLLDKEAQIALILGRIQGLLAKAAA